MSKLPFCPQENVNSSGISKPPDGVGDGLYVKDLTYPLTFRPPVLMKKWKSREISSGMCPAVIKLEKYLFFILITQAYGSVSNFDAVVSNSTVTLSPIFAFIQGSHSKSKNIHVSLLCEHSVDLILATTFHNLLLILNVIVAYISNVTMYISFQMLL